MKVFVYFCRDCPKGSRYVSGRLGGPVANPRCHRCGRERSLFVIDLAESLDGNNHSAETPGRAAVSCPASAPGDAAQGADRGVIPSPTAAAMAEHVARRFARERPVETSAPGAPTGTKGSDGVFPPDATAQARGTAVADPSDVGPGRRPSVGSAPAEDTDGAKGLDTRAATLSLADARELSILEAMYRRAGGTLTEANARRLTELRRKALPETDGVGMPD